MERGCGEEKAGDTIDARARRHLGVWSGNCKVAELHTCALDSNQAPPYYAYSGNAAVLRSVVIGYSHAENGRTTHLVLGLQTCNYDDC
jgi:hypothetical protein